MEYLEQKQKHQDEISNFPMFFAFSEKQFNEGLEKFGATIKEIARIPGGGFIRKVDGRKLGDLLLRHGVEQETAMKDDDFLTDAIRYELGNHEYCITYNPAPTMDCLGIDLKTADERVIKCFKEAREDYLSQTEDG